MMRHSLVLIVLLFSVSIFAHANPITQEEIMSRNHIHNRYDKYPPVDAPVKRGEVEIGAENYEQWQGPYGWYYCYADDGECFDREGLGVDPSGSCWVNSEHECVGPGEERDVSYFVKDFRFRGDLGPPMTISDSSSAADSPYDDYPDDYVRKVSAEPSPYPDDDWEADDLDSDSPYPDDDWDDDSPYKDWPH